MVGLDVAIGCMITSGLGAFAGAFVAILVWRYRQSGQVHRMVHRSDR